MRKFNSEVHSLCYFCCIHSGLPDVKKNFYFEDPIIRDMSVEEADDFRLVNLIEF